MQEEHAQLQSAAKGRNSRLTGNFQPHRSLQSSLGCHCPIPVKLKGISCLKPSRAFASPLEFLPLDAPKEEDGISLVDLELGCRGLGVVFF